MFINRMAHQMAREEAVAGGNEIVVEHILFGIGEFALATVAHGFCTSDDAVGHSMVSDKVINAGRRERCQEQRDGK